MLFPATAISDVMFYTWLQYCLKDAWMTGRILLVSCSGLNDSEQNLSLLHYIKLVDDTLIALTSHVKWAPQYRVCIDITLQSRNGHNHLTQDHRSHGNKEGPRVALRNSWRQFHVRNRESHL